MISMQEARQIAQKRLAPSEKDLQHGLELHAASFVFDAYGFMPLSHSMPENLQQLIDEGMSRDELQRLLASYHMHLAFRNQEKLELLKKVWEFSGVDAVFQNSGEEGNDLCRLLERLGNYTATVDEHPELYRRAVNADQLLAAKKEGRRVLYFTTNGVPLPGKMISAKDELSQIANFANLGVRMMHLTYNRRNLIGDGCAEVNDGGLSAFGRDVIAEMNRCGVIPDAAHSSNQTAIDAAKCSKKPVVISHSMCAGMGKMMYRAKSDEAIKAVAATGGYIGICAFPHFMGGTQDINAMLDHIEYAVKLVGADHVAIGTDHSMGIGDDADAGIKVPPQRPIWEQYWRDPQKDFSGRVSAEEEASLMWSNWPLFTVGLVQRGFSDDEIAKIIGGNVLRVCRDSLT